MNKPEEKIKCKNEEGHKWIYDHEDTESYQPSPIPGQHNPETLRIDYHTIFYLCEYCSARKVISIERDLS